MADDRDKLADEIRNVDEISSRTWAVVGDELPDIVRRVRAAGAKGPLTYQGAGATGVVFCDTRGDAYKANRWPNASKTVEREAEWLEAAAQVPAVRPHVAKFRRWDRRNEVLVRECVQGKLPSESKLWGLHERITAAMAPYGWGRPEYKRDSYVLARGRGPVLVDAGMAVKRGRPLVREVLDVLNERTTADATDLADLAYAVRWERDSTIPAKVADRLLDRLNAKAGKPLGVQRRHRKLGLGVGLAVAAGVGLLGFALRRR